MSTKDKARRHLDIAIRLAKELKNIMVSSELEGVVDEKSLEELTIVQVQEALWSIR